MNWAIPCAPAPLTANGLTFDSASSWAASSAAEVAAFPDQGAERRGVGFDDRVRVGGRAAIDVDGMIGDPDVERVLAQAQLVADVQLAGGLGVEEGPEGEDDGVGADGRIAGK